MALFTRANLKTWLGIAGTSEDSKLDQIVAGIDKAVKRYCGRDFERTTYTDELIDGNGRDILYLRHRPLISVSSLYVSTQFWGGESNSDAFPSGTLWTRNQDFIIPSVRENEQNMASVVAIRGLWPAGYSNIKATYVAGYSTIPDDLVMACYQLAAQVRTYLNAGAPVASESFGDYSYTLLRGSQTPEIASARSILNGFRQIAV